MKVVNGLLVGVNSTAKLAMKAAPNSDANVSNPPTDAELDAAFGLPAAVGDGYIAILDDAGTHTAVWFIASDGAAWWHGALTKAV